MTSEQAVEDDSGTPQEDLKPLKFARSPRTNAAIAAKEGVEAATVRYEDEKDIESGDRLRLVDKYGPCFGEADVTDTEILPAGKAFAYILESGAHYPKDSYDHMMSALNDHYGGGISAGTEVKVIIYRPEKESMIRHLSPGERDE